MEDQIVAMWREAYELGATNDLINKILQLDPEAVNANRFGCTLLHFAANHGLLDSIAILLLRGADVNTVNATFQETPLHIMAERLDPRGCIQLLEAGADPTALDWHGRTPFDSATTGDIWQESEIRKLTLQILGKAEVDRIIRSTPKITTDKTEG